MFDGRINMRKLLRIYFCIQRTPGISASWIERKLGYAKTTIRRNLATFDMVGLYLYEDDHGGLYVWQK